MSGTRGRAHTPWMDRPISNRSLAMTRCPDCGKLCYRSRAEAKRAGRQQPFAARAYQCGEYWHLTSQDTQATTFHREQGR